MQIHYQRVYQLISNGWKFGDHVDDTNKLSPMVKHFHALTLQDKAEYAVNVRAFISAIYACEAYIEPLDNLEWLYLQVVCHSDPSTDHVADVFQAFGSVRCPVMPPPH